MSEQEFEPEKYHDEYRERFLAVVERKQKGHEITVAALTGGFVSGNTDPMIRHLVSIHACASFIEHRTGAVAGNAEMKTQSFILGLLGCACSYDDRA